MPLPELPASNTARYRVNYEVGAFQHSFQIRSLASPAAISAHVNAFLGALAPILSAMTITFVEFAASGSDVYNIVVTGSEGLGFGSGAQAIGNVPLGYNFIGRTSGGRRVRRAVFGANTTGTNFRYAPGESADIDAAINVLDGAAGLVLGIDGATPLWKQYANVKYFDHWTKEIR